MTKTVWKFKLTPQCEIDMPEGAQVLSVHEQGDDICLWALVDPSAPLRKRRFVGFCTGHPIAEHDGLQFVGTAMLQSGTLVLHIFEVSQKA